MESGASETGAPPLACSVRGCGAELVRRARSFVCSRGHAFDLARSGYVNLLQPQDRRSRTAGDSRAAVEARARSWAAGAGDALLAELRRHVSALGLGRGAVAVELGCGAGEVLGALAEEHALVAVGIDLASAAVERAARRFPGPTWVVANADRRLPVADASVDLVLAIHGRRNPAECARVLRPGGHVLAALGAEDDLAELRALVQGRAEPSERARSFLAEHEALFALRARSTARERRKLGHAVLLDLLAGTYRGQRRSEVDALTAALAPSAELEVTLASDVLLLARR